MTSETISALFTQPFLYQESTVPFWDDDRISKHLLVAHLTTTSCLAVLRAIAKSLRPGSILLIDVFTPTKLCEFEEGRAWDFLIKMDFSAKTHTSY